MYVNKDFELLKTALIYNSNITPVYFPTIKEQDKLFKFKDENGPLLVLFDEEETLNGIKVVEE